jgi:hypothetical protein
MALKCEFCKNAKISSLLAYSCNKCNKKNLCGNCRLPEYHKCDYDFAKEGEKSLREQNPNITTTKVAKI